MKRVLIGDLRIDLATTFETLIKNWGYRVLVAESIESYSEILEKLAPELQIVGPSFLSDPALCQLIGSSQTPLLTIADPQQPVTPPKGEVLSYPVDIFRLFSMVQGELEDTPRRNIRLSVKLPGLYFSGDKSCIAEVLSLSTAGLFLKTGTRLEDLDTVRLILPLIGMQKEMELSGRIVYRVDPGPENNYLQGIGVEFINLDDNTVATLERYIEGLLFNDLHETRATRSTFETGHLRPHLLPELLPVV